MEGVVSSSTNFSMRDATLASSAVNAAIYLRAYIITYEVQKRNSRSYHAKAVNSARGGV
jgi:hypothetical protein